MSIATRAADAAAGPSALEAAFARAADEAASRRRGALATVVLSIDGPDPVALHAAAIGLGLDATLLLQPSHHFGLVGIGEAWSIEPAGSDRTRSIDRAWSALLEDAAVPTGPVPRGAGPVLLGGFAFADRRAVTATWRGFEGARMVLPELLVTTTPGGDWLTASGLTGASGGTAGPAARLGDRWQAMIAAVGADTGTVAPPAPLRIVRTLPDHAGWRDSVARLAGAVGRGRLDKAVLARQVEAVSAAPIDVPLILRRLCAAAPESTVFAVSRNGRTFLGATPERLVARRGRDVRTVAMAGSTRRAADEESDEALADAMLASDKEREEHAVVVEMLRDTLAPLTERLDIAPQPTVVRLRHVQHLVTPVAGRLREPLSVIELAGILHPTPAVAGSPRQLALELIADEEPFERGWFAGPLGWVDREGDGDLVVALRSGIVADRHATLLAGCGIVADSDPDREWQEAETKLQALGTALGGLAP
jgi:isochorismate synthase